MTSLFEEIFGVTHIYSDDPAGAAAMNEDDFIKLEMHRKQSAQDSWNLLSDKEKLHYRMLMGGAAATEDEKK